MERLMALINAALDNSFMTSICIALVTIHVKTKVHRFWLAGLTLVLLWTMADGLNVSTPTYKNGRQGVTLSSCKHAICCQPSFSLNLRQMKYLLISDEINCFDQTIQNPAARTTPSVRCRPWYKCETLRSKWWMSSFSRWWFLEIIIGCFNKLSTKLFFNLPPTRKRPSGPSTSNRDTSVLR